jgi:hypothetical protein
MKAHSLGLLAFALIRVSSVASADNAVDTGSLSFDSTGNLTQATFGTDCGAGFCAVTASDVPPPFRDEWLIDSSSVANFPAFVYSVPFSSRTWSGSVSLSLVAQSSSVTYDFTVTATSGPLSGEVANGSFTFNSSIIPAGGGVVPASGLLTDLSFTWDKVPYTLSSSVPEPATLSLLTLGLGLAGVGSMRRRKKHRASLRIPVGSPTSARASELADAVKQPSPTRVASTASSSGVWGSCPRAAINRALSILTGSRHR